MLNFIIPFTRDLVKRRFSAGSTIIYQGEVPRSACILLSGVVRVFSISRQGDVQIVTFHIAGEFFPTSWIFNKTPGALFFYEAITDCEVAYSGRAELTRFITSSEELVNAALDYFTTNYTASLIRVNALEQSKAREKLAYTLYYLCQRYGRVGSGVKVSIPINLTHQNLAGLVGLTRETTATEIFKLRKEGVISYKQQKYFVNRERLLDIIGEDSFRGISISSKVA